MSIKEEVERLNDAIDHETSSNAKSFLLGKKAGIIETKQKMIEEFKEVEELLLDVLFQSCGDRKDETLIDNECISAYEDACDYLTKKGYLKNINGRGYKIIKTEVEKIE